MALMCFHASRFNARQMNGDSLVLYEQQDETLWDYALIEQGKLFLYNSAQGDELSSYHLEARIASWHCLKEDTTEKWEDILRLYDRLLLVNYSPSVALNRTFALYKVKGARVAIKEAEALKLERNHFYFLLIGELYKNIDKEKAKSNFQMAYSLAKTETEKFVIQNKLQGL